MYSMNTNGLTTMSHAISARIDDELYEDIKMIAKKRKRKISEILTGAIDYYLVALELLHDPKDSY